MPANQKIQTKMVEKVDVALYISDEQQAAVMFPNMRGEIDKRKGITLVIIVFSLLLLPLLVVSPTGFDLNNNFAAMAQEQVLSSTSSSSSNQTEIVVAQTPEEQANLDRFDRLDFEAWNNRNWTLFEELHSPDVLVVDSTGNTTRGIDQHLQWAMGAVSASPESRVLAHL
jgi:hypothetical protein